MPKLTLFLLLTSIFQLNCVNNTNRTIPPSEASALKDSLSLETSTYQGPKKEQAAIQMGAERMDLYLPTLAGKRIALVVNQTSRVQRTNGSAIHLVDTLQSRGLQLTKIFALEHGFRGTEDAGAIIKNGIDEKSGLPIVTLYGKKKEPAAVDLADIDIIIFDIQDVGARFYTYISSLHYLMQGAAKQGKPVMILDRPNPNGHYVDGPILDPNFQSFIGMHPIPVVHGMTIGEYGKMINGEGWLDGGRQAELTVIPCENYTHTTPYELPVRPSPNLPNQHSILLYPSLCFFEGTTVSAGRGTLTQFQVFGHPDLPTTEYPYSFTPIPGPGSADPKLNGVLCQGKNLSTIPLDYLYQSSGLNLNHLVSAYSTLGKDLFSRPDFFDLLAGSDRLRKQILAGDSVAAITASWQVGLTEFRETRGKYLLYP
jgi:uncharacterized protein YbbC (DUF1343 family)